MYRVVDVDLLRVRDPLPVKLDLLYMVLTVAFSHRVSHFVLVSLPSQ